VVLDRNLVELAQSGRADEIGETQVELTIFDGKVVYEAGR
jgi:predicted amidohydrolase YtcJ